MLHFDKLSNDIKSLFAKIKVSTDELEKQNELLFSSDKVTEQIVKFVMEMSIAGAKVDLFNDFKNRVSNEITQAIKSSLLEFKNELPISPASEMEHLSMLCDVFEPIIKDLYISGLETNYKSCDFQTLNLSDLQCLVPNDNVIGESIKLCLAGLRGRVSVDIYNKFENKLLNVDFTNLDDLFECKTFNSDSFEMNQASVNLALNGLNIMLTLQEVVLEHDGLSKKLSDIRVIEILAKISNEIFRRVISIPSYSEFYKVIINKHNESNIIRARMALDDTNIRIYSINANTYAFIVSRFSIDFRNRFLNGDGKPAKESRYFSHPLLTSGAMTSGEASMLILNTMTNAVAFSNNVQIDTIETPSVSPRLSAVSNFSPRMLHYSGARSIVVDAFNLNQKNDAAASSSDDKTVQEEDVSNKRQRFSCS